MLLITCSLALLALYAGTKLAIQVKLDALGRLYKFISWFVVATAFLIVCYTGITGVIHSCWHSSM